MAPKPKTAARNDLETFYSHARREFGLPGTIKPSFLTDKFSDGPPPLFQCKLTLPAVGIADNGGFPETEFSGEAAGSKKGAEQNSFQMALDFVKAQAVYDLVKPFAKTAWKTLEKAINDRVCQDLNSFSKQQETTYPPTPSISQHLHYLGIPPVVLHALQRGRFILVWR